MCNRNKYFRNKLTGECVKPQNGIKAHNHNFCYDDEPLYFKKNVMEMISDHFLNRAGLNCFSK